QGERLQALKQRLVRGAAAQQRGQAAALQMAVARLAHARPDTAALRKELGSRVNRLSVCAPHVLTARRSRLTSARQTLEALNPRKILDRGYAIVRDQRGALVKNALDLNKGDRLMLELGQGGADVEVINP